MLIQGLDGESAHWGEPDVGHLVYWEQPKRVAEQLRERAAVQA